MPAYNKMNITQRVDLLDSITSRYLHNAVSHNQLGVLIC